MKTFKVNKNLNKEPYIFGLKVHLFFIFIGIIFFVFFSFISKVSWSMSFVSMAILVISYAILRFMNSGSIADRISKDNFPDIIINDNYR